MQKLMPLFLVAGLMWGIFVVALINSSNAHEASRLAPRSSIVGSVRNKVTSSILRTHIGPQVSVGRSHSHSSSLVVALTFDDGPGPTFTPQILSILQRYDVHATFFCIGQRVRLYPALVEQEFSEGNVIGDHTWSHPNLTKLAPYAVRRQLSLTSSAIQYAIGSPPELFRPPYGATDATVENVASQLGLLQVLWTIDPRDWARPGVNAIVNIVLSHVTNGSIILLHDGGGDRSETVQALPLIISALQQRGFTFITL